IQRGQGLEALDQAELAQIGAPLRGAAFRQIGMFLPSRHPVMVERKLRLLGRRQLPERGVIGAGGQPQQSAEQHGRPRSKRAMCVHTILLFPSRQRDPLLHARGWWLASSPLRYCLSGTNSMPPAVLARRPGFGHHVVPNCREGDTLPRCCRCAGRALKTPVCYRVDNITMTPSQRLWASKRRGSVAKLGFGGKSRSLGFGKSIACELKLSCFR